MNEFLVRNPSQHFEKLDELQMLVLPHGVEVDHTHLAHPIAVYSVLLNDVECCVLHHEIHSVVHSHVLLPGLLIVVVHLLDPLQVGLQHIVNVDGPQQLVPEFLPRVGVRIGHDVLVDEAIQGLLESGTKSLIFVFLLGYSHQDLQEFVAHKGRRRVVVNHFLTF